MIARQKVVVALIFILTVGVLLGVSVWPKQTTDTDLNLSRQQSDRAIVTPLQPFSTTRPTQFPSPSQQRVTPAATPVHSLLYEPTTDFKQRVTKKPFGLYVTPTNSPISPERFTGWHTGADAEYGNIASEVTVHAISNGVVLSARRSNGYGGIVVIEHVINGAKALVIYGHLDPASLVPETTVVTAGQQIGLLGDSYSEETDGERKHLHLGVLQITDKLDVKGYVNKQTALNKWLDPMKLDMKKMPDINI